MEESTARVTRGSQKPCFHVAPRAGVMTVFCNVEYPVGDPPERMVIAGDAFVLANHRREDGEVEL